MIPEVPGGAHHSPDAAAASLKDEVVRQIEELSSLSPEDLRNQRYEKFRQFGEWQQV